MVEHQEVLQITSQLRLRKVQNKDYEVAVSWYANKSILWYSENRIKPYSMKEITKMYDFLSENDVLYFIEIFEGNWNPIGDITLSDKRLPMILIPSYQGKGIGTQVLKFMLIHAKSMGYESIKLSGIYTYNDRSINTYKKIGFKESNRDEQKIYMGIIL